MQLQRLLYLHVMDSVTIAAEFRLDGCCSKPAEDNCEQQSMNSSIPGPYGWQCSIMKCLGQTGVIDYRTMHKHIIYWENFDNLSEIETSCVVACGTCCRFVSSVTRYAFTCTLNCSCTSILTQSTWELTFIITLTVFRTAVFFSLWFFRFLNVAVF